jgi:hypothetical protein
MVSPSPGRGAHNSSLGEHVVSTRTLIAAVVALALALAGCGSSNSSSSSASSAASATTSSTSPATSSSTSAASPAAFKAAFLADRTQFRELGTSLQKALTQAGNKTDAQLATQLSALSSKAKAQAAKLSQLNPPAKYKPTLDKLVTALNNVATRLDKIATDANNHSAGAAKSDTIKLIQEAGNVKAADTQLSTSLGLPANS